MMIRKLIVVLILICCLTLTIRAAYANQGRLQIRGHYGTHSIYSGNKNKVNVQLSTRAYYAIKNQGIENIKLKLNNSKRTKNLRVSTLATNAHLIGRNLVFSLPNNLLKHKGTHYLTITTSNQSFDGSFNYIPTFEIVNNTNGGLEVEIAPDTLVEDFDSENSEGLVIEGISEEEPIQNISSGNGLEISFE
jgi:hypothetical protein